MLYGGHTQRRSQMSFAHTERTEKDDIFGVFEKPHSGEFIDLPIVNGGLGAEIKIFQRFLDEEPGHLHLLFIGAPALGLGLLSEDMAENLHDVQVVVHGALQVVVEDFQGILHLQAFKIFPKPFHRQFTDTAPRHTGSDHGDSSGNQ